MIANEDINKKIAIEINKLFYMAETEANDNVASNKKALKYKYKVNMNILIPKTPRTLIAYFYEENFEKRKYWQLSIHII